jgi:hypothetical protein
MTSLNDIINLPNTDKVIKFFFFLNVLYKTTIFLYCLTSILMDEHILLEFIIFAMIMSILCLISDFIIHYDIFYTIKLNAIPYIWSELTPIVKGFWFRGMVVVFDMIIYSVGDILLKIIDKNKDDITAVVITDLHLLFVVINGHIFLLYAIRHIN